MPSLVAFGRRWNISSDDFVFPGRVSFEYPAGVRWDPNERTVSGMTEAFVRAAWLGLRLWEFPNALNNPLHSRVIVAFTLYFLHSPFHCSKWEWLLYIGVMVAINLLAS